jgi:uncharacterized phiE125 gp8 family phage protein
VRASWQLVTAPVQEPISVAEAKQHAKINQDKDDVTVARFIKTAREAAEDYMNRALYTQTWQLVLDCFADIIHLPRAAPLQSVTTVKYWDTAGVQQTLASTFYTVDTVARPGRLTRAYNQVWPPLQDRYSGKIEITYVVGFSTVAAIPERIKQGIRMYVAYLDSDREGFDQDGERARKAAEACWDDRVIWIEPESYLTQVGYR